jgi:CelD/BcsL family acetyltransferase involved in cellulose biosynthesis
MTTAPPLAVRAAPRSATSRAADAAPPLDVTLIGDLAGLDAVADAWTALLAAQPPTQSLFFQSYPWCRHVASVRLDMRPRTVWRLAVAELRCGGNLIGIWPLCLQKQAGIWQARSLDDPFGQFAGLVCAPGQVNACVAAVVATLRSNGLCDVIAIEKVVEGSKLAQALAAAGASASLSGHSVVLDVTKYADFTAYEATLNRKTAKNLRNALNRLKRVGSVSHDIVTEAPAVGTLIKNSFEGRLAWMQIYGKTAPAFREPDYRTLVESLGSAAHPVGLIGFALKSVDRTIAEQWGFVHRNTYYAYISARDMTISEFSAGRVHLGLIIKACFAMKLDRLELMSPASDYKLSWSDDTKRIDDYAVALTPKGWAHLEFWTKRLRPLIKATYHVLPQPVRLWLTGTPQHNSAETSAARTES